MFQIRFYTLILIILNATHGIVTNAVNGENNSGAQYLQNAIRDIQVKNAERNVLMFVGNTNTNTRRVVPRTKISQMQRLKPYLIDTNRRFSGNNFEPEPQHFPEEPPHPVYHHEEPQTSHSMFSSDNHDPIEHHESHIHPQEINTHPVEHYNSHGHIPDPPSLTKGELAALYEAAVLKGNTVHLNGLNAINYHGTAHGVEDALPVQAAIHEIREPHGHFAHHGHGHGQGNAHAQANTDAYYYYYYPLKSFLDNIPQFTNQVHHKEKYKSPVLQTSHTHLHNVKVEPIRTVMELPAAPTRGKALEPLFMAISGLVGMAVMFMFSMVLLPRFSGAIKKKKLRQGRHLFEHSSLSDTDLNWKNMFDHFVKNVENIDCPACSAISRNLRIFNDINSSLRSPGNSAKNEENIYKKIY